MRVHLGTVVLAVSCAVHPSPEPDATHDVVRATVAPGEDIELTRQTVIHDREYPAARARVWNALQALGEDLAMQLESADPAAGTVVYFIQTATPRIAGKHASAWLDCGRGPGGAPRVHTYHLTVRLTVFLESAGEHHTKVRSGLVGYARDRGLIGDRLPCTSTGQLEQHTLAVLAARVTP